jgi:hypothetical protein
VPRFDKLQIVKKDGVFDAAFYLHGRDHVCQVSFEGHLRFYTQEFKVLHSRDYEEIDAAIQLGSLKVDPSVFRDDECVFDVLLGAEVVGDHAGVALLEALQFEIVFEVFDGLGK